MPLIRPMLPLAAVALSAMPAAAQSCVFTNTGIDFGNVTLNVGQNTTVGTITANCTGTPNQTVRICPNFGAGSGGVAAGGDPRYMLQGAGKLGFNLYQTNGIGKIWGSYTWGLAPTPPVLSLVLGSNGAGSLSQSVFARIANGQTAAATGTYSSSFSGASTQIDYGYSTAFSCGAVLSPRVQNVPFQVRTTNNSSCTVTTTSLDFGTQFNLNAAKTTANTISVNCSAGTVYEIGLNNGNAGTGPASRLMVNAGTPQTVTYGIYRDASMISPWGNASGINTVVAIGTGSAQNFTGYGRIPAQATPPALTYTDTVIVTITY